MRNDVIIPIEPVVSIQELVARRRKWYLNVVDALVGGERIAFVGRRCVQYGGKVGERDLARRQYRLHVAFAGCPPKTFCTVIALTTISFSPMRSSKDLR